MMPSRILCASRRRSSAVLHLIRPAQEEGPKRGASLVSSRERIALPEATDRSTSDLEIYGSVFASILLNFVGDFLAFVEAI